LLLPLADLITPNIPEAEMLSSLQIRTRADVKKAAQVLNGLYGCAVLIKGGHSKESAAEDILFDGEEWASFSLPRIENPISTHGTGCALSAAIAAELALGRNLKEAVKGAKEYVRQAIEKSYLVGENCGVLSF
jgi:hydroxymethylpyrimidine/phosphomethylpyrimidine kinase